MMIQFYMMMVKANKMSIEDVPLLWKDKVAAVVRKNEDVENGVQL